VEEARKTGKDPTGKGLKDWKGSNWKRLGRLERIKLEEEGKGSNLKRTGKITEDEKGSIRRGLERI
jgi:hypothetical protein